MLLHESFEIPADWTYSMFIKRKRLVSSNRQSVRSCLRNIKQNARLSCV